MIKIIHKKSNFFLLVLVILMLFTIGCQKQPPEGVSQEFYNDMIFSVEDLPKSIKKAVNVDLDNSDILKSDGYIKVENYMSNKDSLTIIERNIVESLSELYICSAIYYNMQDEGIEAIVADEQIRESLGKFSKLMEIEIDVNKIIL